MSDSEAEPAADALVLRQITKRFGSVTACDHIDLVIRAGEIHCLLGENGAGKSTLMNVLYGLLAPDSGEISIDGVPLTATNPKQAIAAGIGMVHQHFMLVGPFTVAENLSLGYEPGTGPVLDLTAARRRVRELTQTYGLEVDPDAIVEDLPVGVQQRVEILKALANDARFLILDEPTAVLTPQETDDLMVVMRSLRDAGRGIVFITHKLREVRAIADRITVIRRGAVVGTAEPSTSETELAELMVGRAVNLTVATRVTTTPTPRLKISGLTIAAASGQVAVDALELEVGGGEIVGIAGVQGNGQTELAEALVGLRRPTAGSITLDGTDLTTRSTKQTINAGVGFVPEDRKLDGFIGSFSIAENLVLNCSDDPAFLRGSLFGTGLLNQAAIEANAEQRLTEFDIRAPSIHTPVASLSGGNQQKVVLARELSSELRLLVANQPTRGVDVGAIEFLHQRIVAERDRGTAVLIVSTELDEVVALADRIAVMYRGRIVGIVKPDVSREVLGLMMAGVSGEEAVAAATVTSAAEEDAALDEFVAAQAREATAS